MTNPTHHITDITVQTAIGEATAAACSRLDQLFPGGITCEFKELLRQILETMTTGTDPRKQSGHVTLPTLAIASGNADSSGSIADAYLVTKIIENEWLPGKVGKRPVRAVLDETGTHFIRMTESEHIKPYTSFEAALKAAVTWLEVNNVSQNVAKLLIVPAYACASGWRIHDNQTLAVA